MIWVSSEFNWIAENVLHEYDPDSAPFSTLVYGPAKVGKTELLLKCYKRLKDKIPVLYLDSQDFVKNYVFAAQEGTLSQFRLKLRNSSLLIIDHIEILKGKAHSIEEFYHTYEALFQHNSKIICSFTGEPSQLNFLGDKLASRLLGGLAIPIAQPSGEDLLKYLRLMSHAKLLVVEDMVLELMAKEVSNFYDAQILMQGFIKYVNKVESALDKEALALYLRERKRRERQRPSPENIIQKTAEITGISPEEISGVSRTARVVKARQLAVYGMRHLGQLSYPQIGSLLNRSHSSIFNSYLQFQEAIKTNSELRERAEMLLGHFNTYNELSNSDKGE